MEQLSLFSGCCSLVLLHHVALYYVFLTFCPESMLCLLFPGGILACITGRGSRRDDVCEHGGSDLCCWRRQHGCSLFCAGGEQWIHGAFAPFPGCHAHSHLLLLYNRLLLPEGKPSWAFSNSSIMNSDLLLLLRTTDDSTVRHIANKDEHNYFCRFNNWLIVKTFTWSLGCIWLAGTTGDLQTWEGSGTKAGVWRAVCDRAAAWGGHQRAMGPTRH